MTRCSFVLLMGLAAFLAGPLRARGDEAPWYVSYDNALRAQDRGDWMASLNHHLPRLYMVAAHYRIPRSADALTGFDREEREGVIQDAPEEYAVLLRLKAELQRKQTVAAGETDDVPWYKSYCSALAYIDANDWANAVENLQSAIRFRSEPARDALTHEHADAILQLDPYNLVARRYTRVFSPKADDVCLDVKRKGGTQ